MYNCYTPTSRWILQESIDSKSLCAVTSIPTDKDSLQWLERCKLFRHLGVVTLIPDFHGFPLWMDNWINGMISGKWSTYTERQEEACSFTKTCVTVTNLNQLMCSAVDIFIKIPRSTTAMYQYLSDIIATNWLAHVLQKDIMELWPWDA